MTQLEKISEFITRINFMNSRKYKEEVLKDYIDDNDIKLFLYYMFNPYIVTGISRKKVDFEPDSSVLTDSNAVNSNIEILDMFNNIVSKESINNNTLLELYAYFKSIPEQYVPLAKLIITKNIQLGIDAITINKIFSNLIPTFNIQLAEKYFEHPEYIEGKYFYITTKIDGGRIIAIKENGKVKFYTRAGQLYEGLVDLKNELEAFDMDNFVLDGEITLLDKGSLSSKDQYKATMKITRKDGEKHGVRMLVFDYINIEEFKSQNSITPYDNRRAILDNTIGEANLKYFNVLPVLYKGNDVSVISKLLDEQTSNGEEGIMINIASAPYKFKRTLDLLKVKKMQDIDLRITGFEEGRNRHQGELGAFLVNFYDNIVKVGTGLSDELRQEVWNNQDKYIGKIISVKYFEQTTNDKGRVSLRFPVFVDFRYDKNEADDEYQMFLDEHKLDNV